MRIEDALDRTLGLHPDSHDFEAWAWIFGAVGA